MWSFDDAQVKILLSGMAKLPDMEFISIRVDGQTKLFVGKQISKMSLPRNFPRRSPIVGKIGPSAS